MLSERFSSTAAISSIVRAGTGEVALGGNDRNLNTSCMSNKARNTLKRKLKVERGNSQPLAKIESMGLLTMGAGVETERVTVSLSSQCDKPLDHGLAMSHGSRICVRYQIVHIKRLSA